MNINATTSYSQNFQARIKMNKPKLEILAQTALGTSALATGAATVAEGAFSFNAAFGDDAYSIESIPREVVNSHKDFLTSAGHRYDAAGETGGLPVQSTIVPFGLSASGSGISGLASNAYKNAFGEDNLKATTVMPIDASKAVLANKSAQKSLLGSSYLGTAAASLYSGFKGDELNQILPESLKSNPQVLNQFEKSSQITGEFSASIPVVLGSGKIASIASDTKSGQFVADTFLGDGKSNKKIPS